MKERKKGGVEKWNIGVYLVDAHKLLAGAPVRQGRGRGRAARGDPSHPAVPILRLTFGTLPLLGTRIIRTEHRRTRDRQTPVRDCRKTQGGSAEAS